jgi:hypothetical protein
MGIIMKRDPSPTPEGARLVLLKYKIIDLSTISSLQGEGWGGAIKRTTF